MSKYSEWTESRKGKQTEKIAELPPSIFERYNARVAKQDEALVREANEGMDAMMVFAGLFSAVIATLIQVTWNMLAPQPSDYTNQLLLSIYNATVNQTTKYPVPDEFHPETKAIVINVLYFLSLVLSLGAALGAILVKEWARQYSVAAESEKLAPLKARNRHRLYEGYTRWPFRATNASIPLLLHGALLLFLVGTITWASSLHVILYTTLLVVVAGGAAGYATLVVSPPFEDSSPFVWSLSLFFKHTLNNIWNRFKPPSDPSTRETQPRPSYILFPVKTPPISKIDGPGASTPTLNTPNDARILVDELRNSQQLEDLEFAMDGLITGTWDRNLISKHLVNHEGPIFRQYQALAATCRDVESGTLLDNMLDRIRRLLRFTEWFYYQLSIEQRRQVRGWPSVDMADQLLDEALEDLEDYRTGDIVLSHSVRSKLHHVNLPRDTACTFCLKPTPGRLKYAPFFAGRESLDNQREYFRDLLSTCIWSDTDCVLYYAKAPDAEAWRRQTKETLELCLVSFLGLRPITNSDSYSLLRSLLDERMESLHISDPRREWFISLDRARRYKHIHPENRTPRSKGQVESAPSVPLLPSVRSADIVEI